MNKERYGGYFEGRRTMNWRVEKGEISSKDGGEKGADKKDFII